MENSAPMPGCEQPVAAEATATGRSRRMPIGSSLCRISWCADSSQVAEKEGICRRQYFKTPARQGNFFEVTQQREVNVGGAGNFSVNCRTGCCTRL